MFILNNDFTLSFASLQFIQEHRLPPYEKMRGVDIKHLLEFITAAQTEQALRELSILDREIKTRQISNEITTFIVSVKGIKFALCLRRVLDENIIGTFELATQRQIQEDKTNRVGDELTRELLSRRLPKVKEANLVSTSLNNSSVNRQGTNIKAEAKPSVCRAKQPPRVLIVDDSDVNLEVVNIFLTSDFPKVLFAKNGIEALNVLKKHTVDVIIMDIHMPEMNGVDATTAIRNIGDSSSDVIIIALTSDATYLQKKVYLEAGFDNAISKPVRQDILVRTILEHWNAMDEHRDIKPVVLEYAS